MPTPSSVVRGQMISLIHRKKTHLCNMCTWTHYIVSFVYGESKEKKLHWGFPSTSVRFETNTSMSGDCFFDAGCVILLRWYGYSLLGTLVSHGSILAQLGSNIIYWGRQDIIVWWWDEWASILEVLTRYVHGVRAFSDAVGTKWEQFQPRWYWLTDKSVLRANNSEW